MSKWIIQGSEVPEDMQGTLQPFTGAVTDTGAFQSVLDAEGYLYLQQALDREAVLAARREVLTRLHEVSEIAAPAEAGIATGCSLRREKSGDNLGAFWQSVSEGTALRAVTHGEQLRQLVGSVLDEPARPHDMMYLRPMPVGRHTPLHYDYPFFAGYSNRILTAWVPFGDLQIENGPLMLVEGSHHFNDLLNPIRELDYVSDHSNDTVQQAAYEMQNTKEPIAFVQERSTRMLSANFQAGDVVIFSGFMLHGSLENCSETGAVRLSCDVRYQPVGDPATDERYFGANPKGSKGGGYADMKGAKPLDE